ncbi:MAG: MBL fold metallo-hydrolase [Gemmatimonadaceae bacterium]|nr:MBL fold metallo-hydrolase [Gemmatimonadaceae bacterium]
MASQSPVSIVNVGYRSTNFWVVSTRATRFLIDLGWPGQFGALEAELKRKGVPLAEISHGFATHFHIDHAGAAQDLKNRGMRLIVTPEQVPFIDGMKQFVKPTESYTDIRLTDNMVVALPDSRAFLSQLGLSGEFVHTPGHSDDSVSVLLDSGDVFTGDLTHPAFITDAEAEVTNASWQALRARGATTVYAGHGPVRPFPTL